MILTYNEGNPDRKSTKNMPKKQALEHAYRRLVNKQKLSVLKRVSRQSPVDYATQGITQETSHYRIGEINH